MGRFVAVVAAMVKTIAFQSARYAASIRARKFVCQTACPLNFFFNFGNCTQLMILYNILQVYRVAILTS